MLTKIARGRAGRTLAALSVLSLILGGCAGSRPATYGPEHKDPLEGLNRGIHKFNRGFDRFVFRPVAKGYEVVLPRPVRIGVGNFFDNLRYPITIVNDLLQGKFKQAGADTGRLVLNSTLGLGGIFDPATEAGLEKHNEDFGQTLAVWGVASGPFIEIPFLGPSTLRDGFGRIVDTYPSPLIQYNGDRSDIQDKLVILFLIETRASLLPVDDAINKAFDSYTFIKEAHRQRRTFVIFDGDPPEEDLEEEFLDDEFEDDDLEDYEPGGGL